MMTIGNFKSIEWGAEICVPTSRSLANSPHFVGGRYPCRSVAYVPRFIIESAAAEDGNLSVLDPFMGSGTTAIEASRFSKIVYGVEVDPYARLIATVSTTRYSRSDLEELRALIPQIVATADHAQPEPNLLPELKNLEYWFGARNFEDLAKLKASIFCHTQHGKQRDFLLTAFGDIIRACSKAERQSLKPYISKKYTKVPKLVFEEFGRIAPKYLRAIVGNQFNLCEELVWAGENATDFDLSGSVSIAITSPPYINAMDYTRCIKLESAWIGTGTDDSLRAVRSLQLGESSRRHTGVKDDYIQRICMAQFGELFEVDPVRFHTAVSFFDDMKRNLECVRKSLKEGGAYYLIIGNSTMRGMMIATHEIIAEIASSVGFSWNRYFKYRIRDHRTSIPRGDRGGKIEFEHVIGLKKR